jgi:hypothetical protein
VARASANKSPKVQDSLPRSNGSSKTFRTLPE